MNPPAVLGIDLGGTNCRGAVVAGGRRQGELHRMPTRIEAGRESFFERLLSFCGELQQRARSLGLDVAAVGMGVPGLISRQGRILASPNLSPLDDLDLARLLEAELSLPTLVLNDANAIAWGEATCGAGREFGSFLTVTLGTGVGGALILDRQLWLGSDGAAGEIGHVTVEPGGRPCNCGSRGCLERYASATGIVDSVRTALAAGEESLLAGKERPSLTCDAVATAARKEDPVARQAFATAGRTLGQALAAVANLLNPDGAVIAGGVGGSFDLMKDSLDQELALRAFGVARKRLRIMPGRLGDEGGILGAAELALEATRIRDRR